MDSLQRFQNSVISGALSLDRVTFLVFSPSLSLWDSDVNERELNQKRIKRMSDLIERSLKDFLSDDFPQGKPSELFCHHYRTSSGVDIQFGSVMPIRRKITDLDYISAFGSADDKEKGSMYQYTASNYCFRVEYNPNETGLDEVFPALHYFSSSGNLTASCVRIARLDIAIDYKASLDPALCYCDKMRKSFLAIGNEGIETVYFGSRSSRNYIRLYNKQKEILERDHIEIGHPLWRFELESKDPFTLDQTPDHGKVMQRFSFYNGGLSSDDWKLNLLYQYAKVYGIKAAFSLLPSATSKRYRKLFDEFDRNPGIESPYEVYCREFLFKFKCLRVQILSALGFKIEGVA